MKNLFNQKKIISVLLGCAFLGTFIYAQGTASVESLYKRELLNLNPIAQKMEKLFPYKNCATFVTRKSGYPLVSMACRRGYSAEDRDKFLDFLFKSGFVFKKESYRLKEGSGLYLYETENPKSSGNIIYIKLFFRDARYLWPRTPRKLGHLAIFVTDLYSTKDLIKWQSLGIPLTYGVLPFRKNSKLVAQKVRDYHQKLWLPLSLEPKAMRPTLGRVLTIKDSFDEEKLAQFVNDALESLGEFEGICTRLGSTFTTSVLAMRSVLAPFKAKGVKYFLDNLSSRKSVAYETAQILSFETYKRDTILDHKWSKMKAHWKKTIARIKKNGFAITVVHAANNSTFRFLQKQLKSKIVQRIEMKYLTQLPPISK